MITQLSAASAARKRRQKLITILGAAGAFMLVMFQNFQMIPMERLKPDYAYARSVSPTDGMGDIRQLAPARPDMREEPMIATPRSGNDLGSISQDWATRQAHLITGGAEERMLADINKKINRVFKFEPVDGEPYPESGYDNGSSDDDGGAGSAEGSSNGRRPASDDEASSGLAPNSMQLVAVNRVQIAWKNRTKVSCSVQGNGVRWDVSRPINNRLDLSFRHESADARSTLNLNYSW